MQSLPVYEACSRWRRTSGHQAPSPSKKLAPFSQPGVSQPFSGGKTSQPLISWGLTTRNEQTWEFNHMLGAISPVTHAGERGLSDKRDCMARFGTNSGKKNTTQRKNVHLHKQWKEKYYTKKKCAFAQTVERKNNTTQTKKCAVCTNSGKKKEYYTNKKMCSLHKQWKEKRILHKQKNVQFAQTVERNEKPRHKRQLW